MTCSMAHCQDGTVEAARGARLWIALVTVWVVWGSTYLGIAVAGETLPPLMGNAIRFAAAAAILAVIVSLAQGTTILGITRRELLASAVMGCAMLGFSISILALAERYVPSGIAALVIAIVPLWVVLLRVITGDRPGAATWAGVAVGLVGIVLIVLPGGTSPRAGSEADVVLWILLLIVSSFTWALLSWLAPRMPLPRNALVTTVYELAAAAVLLGGVSPLIGERIEVDQVSTASLLALGWLTFASVAAYTAYTWLVTHAPMSLVSTYAFVNPAVAVVLGGLVLGEVVTSDVLLGLTFVLGGVVLVSLGERRRTATRRVRLLDKA